MKIGDFKSVSDFFYVIIGAFPKIESSITAFKTTYKSAFAEAAMGTKRFTATFKGLNAAMEANPVGAVIAGVVALIGVIKLVDHAIDKANDNIDDTIAKKDDITQNISNINSELEKVDNQIAELESKKLSITDPSDIATLNTQIGLLEQRKELLSNKLFKNFQKQPPYSFGRFF